MNTDTGGPLSSPVEVSVTSSSSLSSISSTVLFYVWTLTEVNLTVSDTTLRRVRDTCGLDRYQTARLQALAQFQYGSSIFTTDVWPVVSASVSILML